jgi:hypothetical protein
MDNPAPVPTAAAQGDLLLVLSGMYPHSKDIHAHAPIAAHPNALLQQLQHR